MATTVAQATTVAPSALPGEGDESLARTFREPTRGGTTIENAVETWHRFLAGERPEALDRVLADDVVFSSPIVDIPQRDGRSDAAAAAPG